MSSVPLGVIAVWVLTVSTLHGASPLAAGRPKLELMRVATVICAWGMGLWYCTPAGPAQAFIVGSVIVQVVLTVSARLRTALAESQLVAQQRLRADTEAAFLQSVEEVRRLKVEIRTSGDVHDQLSAALQESTSELSVARHKADALAHTLQRVMPYEPESGLLNASKFDTVLQREAARMQRQELPLTIVLARLDYFSDFESTHGRAAYELVIRRVSDAFQQAGQRPGDIAARLDFGTFGLMFPEAEQHYGLRLAEAVRERIQQFGIANRNAPHAVLTLSVGAATAIPNSDITAEILRERAEAALYEATFQGGNRSVRYNLLQTIKLERWSEQDEGLLTLAALRNKLELRGYAGNPKRLKPGEPGRERRVTLDSIEAVVEGSLQIEVDGEARTLRAGDCLYLPKGVVTRIQVIGEQAVVCIEATRK